MCSKDDFWRFETSVYHESEAQICSQLLLSHNSQNSPYHFFERWRSQGVNYPNFQFTFDTAKKNTWCPSLPCWKINHRLTLKTVSFKQNQYLTLAAKFIGTPANSQQPLIFPQQAKTHTLIAYGLRSLIGSRISPSHFNRLSRRRCSHVHFKTHTWLTAAWKLKEELTWDRRVFSRAFFDRILLGEIGINRKREGMKIFGDKRQLILSLFEKMPTVINNGLTWPTSTTLPFKGFHRTPCFPSFDQREKLTKSAHMAIRHRSLWD